MPLQVRGKELRSPVGVVFVENGLGVSADEFLVGSVPFVLEM
jgi:hypothetical protein